ncbi:MAG TPA: hypothetical protein VEI29_00220 [Burkholderiaceae bacterium]|nr:hypothetical protein [Burkholderiaceae bacterium]
MAQTLVLGGFGSRVWGSIALPRGEQDSQRRPPQTINAWMTVEEVAHLLLSGEFFEVGVPIPATFAPLALESAVSSVKRWQQEGRIFAIHDLYPRYQFDSRGRPYPAIERALAILGTWDLLKVGNWFASPNAHLQGRRPRELLASASADVLRAVEQA